jgi:hypothetical protein
MSDSLQIIIAAKDKEVQGLLYAYFVQQIFRVNREEHVLGIMAYGSTLSSTTASTTSTPDFYIIVDSYNQFYQKNRDRLLNKYLPPNIYHIHSPQGSCKYCVIELNHLSKEVGEKAKDVYHLGRFSKRMGLIWSKDEEVEKKIVTIQSQAILSVSKKVLQVMNGSFSLEDFIRRALYLSYEGDVRVEATDKIDKLISAEKSYYESIFKEALAILKVEKNELGFYNNPKSDLRTKLDKFKFNRFISSSRRRAKLRWPKNMLTVDKWLDYILAKIERTQDIKIELSPTEKKYWYIFGWKYFLRLSRKKLIK